MTPDEKTARHQAYVRAAVATGNVIIGNAIEITKETHMHRLADNIPGVSDPADAKKLQAIADALGVPAPIDPLKVKAAFDAFIESMASNMSTSKNDDDAGIAASARRLGLSASETAALVAAKGDPDRYVALRDERLKAGTFGGVKKR